MKRITVGRSQQCDIVVAANYDTVSGVHATIEIDSDNILFEDHSTNGSFVNGKFLHHQKFYIQQGDEIKLAQSYILSWSDLSKYVGTGQKTERLPQIDIVVPQSEPAKPNFESPKGEDLEVIRDKNIHVQVAEEKTKEPKCLHEFNFGAFFFGWLWGIFNNVWYSLLTFIPIVNLFVIIVLGFKGNEHAWEKYSGTPEEFDDKQNRWVQAAWILLLISIVLVCLSNL